MAKEVIIRIISEGEAQPSPIPQEDGKNPNPSGKDKNEEEKSTMGVLGAYVAKRAWSLIKSESQYQMGKYFTATENYKLQTSVDNAMDSIDFGVSLATKSFGASKLFEKTAIGAAGGAMIGFAVALITKAAQTMRTFENEQQKIVDNAYGNYFYGERAGFVAGGHGTEN